MSTDPQKIKAIFLKAVEQCEPGQWGPFLDTACEGDANLRRRVEVLLEAHLGEDSLLDVQARDVSVTIDQPRAEKPGTQIGPYKLIEQIGEGGMGTVWMAQQTEPVRRLVALKLIKPGLDSRQVIARFEAERQALALMDHPNIAKVLDAGATEGGRPFFVMELVKGVPITRFCDERHLTPRQRLDLFVPVCQAIQHAHQKGIIHRDIKPSNVLVALYDDKPVPKIIDFGVAKATGQQLTELTLNTGFGAVVGTLEYMSPEQAGFNQLDIDTRSDIYSLGVLLYELLTGSPPFTRQDLKRVGMLEMLRVIREQEPSKPSTKLSSSDALPSLSANRGTEPGRLTNLVRGELDWIVMKTLEKDRARRYETANGLAADIERYLADEPVQACPPSAGYRLRKLMRRNKVSVAFAGLSLLFLVLLGSGVGWGVRDRAAREADLARDRKAVAQQAATEHKARLSRLEDQVTRALTESKEWLARERLPEAIASVARAETLLAAGESSAALKSDVQLARQAVDLVAELERIQTHSRPGPQHEWVVERHQMFQKLFGDLGIDVDAMSIDEAAQRIAAQPLRFHLVAALESWTDTRRVIWLVDKHDGDPWWERLLLIANKADADEVRSRVRTAVLKRDFKTLEDMAASPDVGQLPVATAEQLARVLFWTERPNLKEASLKVLKTVQARRPDHFGLNMGLQNFLIQVAPPRFEEALSYLRAAEVLRPQSPRVHLNMGQVLWNLGRTEEALTCFRKALEFNPLLAAAHNSLGMALYSQGKRDEAIASFKRAIEVEPKFALAHVNLGKASHDQGREDEAINYLKKSVELDPKLVRAYMLLGFSFKTQGKLDDAIGAYRKAVELNPKLSQAHIELGKLWQEQGQAAESLASFKQAVDADPKDAQAHNSLAWYLVTCHQVSLRDGPRAIELATRAIELDPRAKGFRNTLGVAHYRAGQWKQAIEELSRSFEELGDNAADGFFLAMAHWQTDMKTDARKWFDKSVVWMQKDNKENEELKRFRKEAAELMNIMPEP